MIGLATAYAQLDRLDDARGALERASPWSRANGQAHYNWASSRGRAVTRKAARAAYEARAQDPVTHDRAAARLQARP